MGDSYLQACENISTFSYPRKTSAKGITSEDAQALTSVGRTQGDGMENAATDKIESKANKIRLGDSLIYHPTNFKQLNSKPPVTPSGTVVNLIPKSTTNTKKEKYIFSSLKSKEPKFVPYEPYKAAVNPIIPYEKKNKRISKNNVDINVMVSQLAALKTDVKINVECAKKNDVAQGENDNDKKVYDAEIKKLKEENSQLENQLKFQAQVNAELKNLLVAAVGEDLESRVHLLTEDKLQLSRALLNSAKHLSTHQEQTEWLAGQCEVWRSKFLASSLMVEELAKWKAALCQRTTDLQESIKRLLEEHGKVRETSMRTYSLNYVVAMGKYPTVFQAEVTAILTCLEEIDRRRYVNGHVCICSDSQAALRSLLSVELTSRLVWQCLQMLNKVAGNSWVKLIWVSEHESIAGNEKADELAKSDMPLIGPEPYCSIPDATVKGGIKSWLEKKQMDAWSDRRFTHSKKFIHGPSSRRAKELLSMKKYKVKKVVGALTAHRRLKKHLMNMKYADNATCRRCQAFEETVQHILCECEALATLRMRYFEEWFSDPEGIAEAQNWRIYAFMAGSGLLGDLTLSILRENFAPFGGSSSKRHELASTNIIDLAEGCCQISELLKVQLLSGMDHISLRKEIDVTGLEMKTVAEKTVEQLLMSPNLLMSGRQDAACSAVMGAAVALGGQIFLPNSSTSPNIACCSHCSGDVKQV